MGEEIQQEHFEQADYDRFQLRLEEETEVVRGLFAKRAFDNRTRRLGYELELCLADIDGNPSRNNIEIIKATGNPLFTSELAKFNMEINGNPFSYRGDVFNRVEADLEDLYNQAARAADGFDTRIAMFGVFPSVSRRHLNPHGYMTELHRYNQLNRQLLSMRGRPIRLQLEGEESLVVEKTDVMLEALATSLQIHLQVPFDEIVPTYHAGLWSSMLILAASANSPLVLGKRCWQESRIGIFKQAVDTRNLEECEKHVIPRVHLGKGYIETLLDLFEDNFYYSPILPEVRDQPPEELHHLCLHNGTIWRWVRPIVAHNGDGSYHLRLELRVVPSGPTIVDTLANLVFYVGLTEGLKTLGDDLVRLPFETLEADFYRAARHGLEADAHWPDGQQAPLRRLLLENALPLARECFARTGIEDTDRWLDIVEARVDSEATGARWIASHWLRHGDAPRLVREYIAQAQTNRPVHLWKDQAG
ncbi:MAG: glutamate-cysteine ligase family protein [Gammaproteobacteria bacterium]|jgi:gamma-glutamyl:cysteine ligase YbdK (ATP-grasp superfamily)